jgi:glycosyltransferase involved in cell wall biosynthesis
VASSFTRWAGPNTPLLDLCNHLYKNLRVELNLLSHNTAYSSDFLRWVHFPIIPYLAGSASTGRTRLQYALTNAQRIKSVADTLDVKADGVFVNAAVDTLFSAYLAFRTRIATGYNVLGNDFHSPLYNTLDRFAAWTATEKILAHTEYQKNYYQSRGMDAKRIRVIPHCLDVTRVQKMANAQSGKKPEAPTILYCGRLSPEKGVTLLLDAHDKLSEKLDSKLVIAGDGPMRRYVLRRKKQIEDASDSVVDVLGSQSPEAVLSMMKAADVVVVPSFEERFGMVILEAMCLKKAVVANDVGGIPEIITNGVNGVIVSHNDPDDMASKITDLLNDPIECRRLGEAGFRTVQERYTVQKIAPEFLNFMNSRIKGALVEKC